MKLAPPTTINFSAQPKLSTLLREFPLTVASATNATLTMMYRQVGHRIRTEVLRDQHATYGEQIVVSLIRQLSGHIFWFCCRLMSRRYLTALPT